MGDYCSSGLWYEDDNQVEIAMIELDDLPLSRDLKAVLIGWQRMLDATSPFDKPENNFWVNVYSTVARMIHNQMITELGDGYKIRLMLD